ncbi:ankyrin repeat-containing domain protein [Biscogniauxia mediterranea]|nr:ankyrin repeat-containing domain protein [Biscogniauxia mediterranea]
METDSLSESNNSRDRMRSVPFSLASGQKMKSRLVLAIKNNNLPMLKNMLLDQRYHLSDLFGGGISLKKSALHWAAELGRLEMLEFLIEKAPEPDDSIEAQDAKGWTALFYAVSAETGAMEILELLLHHGARVDHRDRSNKTALRIAAEMGRTEIATRLAKLDKCSELDTSALCCS